jgi:hypothetical protein
MTAAYAVRGDTLEVCYDNGEVWGRPRDLSGRGPTEILLVFRRVKD